MAEQHSASGARRRALEGANLFIYTLVGLAIIVLINWFVNRNDRRWDLTPTHKYSLSPQTVKLLKGLDRDVSLYVFDRQHSTRERRDLLENYSAATHRVKLQYVDPDRHPSLARQYGVRTYGTVIVAAGDRHYEAQNDTEEGVTNALIRVLKGQKTVYFVQGHGERDLDNVDRGGYSRIKKQFENENYQVKTLVLLQKMEIPQDASLLIVAGPQHDYLEQEVGAIKKYIEGGGRAMFMLDPLVSPRADNPENLIKLLANWNVTVKNDLVIDQNPIAQLFGTRPEMPLVIKYGSSPIVQPLARVATLFPLTRSFEVGKNSSAGVTVDSLCETSAESYGVADFTPKMREVGFRAGKDFKGPLTVGVSGSLSGGGDKKPEGRFVALGTSLLGANSYVGFQGNRDLFMNMINWLSANEDLISIRPKPPESQHLDLTTAQMRRILYLAIAGLPLLIVFVGTTVWWRRR